MFLCNNPKDERQSKIFKDKKDQYLAKMASLDQQISSTGDDLLLSKSNSIYKKN